MGDVLVTERPDVFRLMDEAETSGLLTVEQVHALRLWSQGIGYKKIGMLLGISRDAARGRVDRARDVLRRLALEDVA